MSTKPLNTGNLFKKPLPFADNTKNSDNRQNEGAQGWVSPNIPQNQREQLINHETVQTPSMSNSAPLPNLTNGLAHSPRNVAGIQTFQTPNIPISPNSPHKSGSLHITGGLNRETSGAPY